MYTEQQLTSLLQPNTMFKIYFKMFHGLRVCMMTVHNNISNILITTRHTSRHILKIIKVYNSLEEIENCYNF